MVEDYLAKVPFNFTGDLAAAERELVGRDRLSHVLGRGQRLGWARFVRGILAVAFLAATEERLPLA